MNFGLVQIIKLSIIKYATIKLKGILYEEEEENYRYLGKGYPCSTVQSKLVVDAKIEADVVAYKTLS